MEREPPEDDLYCDDSLFAAKGHDATQDDYAQLTAELIRALAQRYLPTIPLAEVHALEVGVGNGRQLRALLANGMANACGIDAVIRPSARDLPVLTAALGAPESSGVTDPGSVHVLYTSFLFDQLRYPTCDIRTIVRQLVASLAPGGIYLASEQVEWNTVVAYLLQAGVTEVERIGVPSSRIGVPSSRIGVFQRPPLTHCTKQVR